MEDDDDDDGDTADGDNAVPLIKQLLNSNMVHIIPTTATNESAIIAIFTPKLSLAHKIKRNNVPSFKFRFDLKSTTEQKF